MRPLAEALGAEHQVVTLALHELDDAHQAEDGVSSYAASVLRRIDALDTPAVLVGWSTGGVVALEVATRRPEKIRGLVLLSATARFLSEPSDESYDAGVDAALVSSMIRKLRSTPDALICDFLSAAHHPERLCEAELAVRTQVALRFGVESLVHGLEYLAATDLRAALGSLATPCLVVHGAEDRIVPCAAAKYLQSHLPSARVSLLESVGHALFETRAAELVERVLRFTREH